MSEDWHVFGNEGHGLTKSKYLRFINQLKFIGLISRQAFFFI